MSLDVGRHDTICALSTAHGYGAIAVVRASGIKAHEIFSRMFCKYRGDVKFSRAMHGQVIDQHNAPVDDVMALLFTKANSYTGEESFEIHCHGNNLIVQKILETISAHGARLAEPGEFTMRAMLNGKIDLAQAESIADLIHAKSKAAQQIALQGVRGGLGEKTLPVREIIVSVLAEIEARMDFPDEDLENYDRAHLRDQLAFAQNLLDELLAHAGLSIRLHEGVRIVICGLPNAGKSTLLNRLLGEERAIVHELAGTTRDVIEANTVLQDLPVTLVDVAGIRDNDDACAVEKIGIAKAIAELEKAHLIIWLADATEPDPFHDQEINRHLNQLDTPILRVLNKVELLNHNTLYESVLAISAKTGFGIARLEAAIHQKFTDDSLLLSELSLTRARQKDELENARSGVREAREALVLGLVDEVITAELRQAGLAFDRLFGTTLSEDILDEIFSKFCIGK